MPLYFSFKSNENRQFWLYRLEVSLSLSSVKRRQASLTLPSWGDFVSRFGQMKTGSLTLSSWSDSVSLFSQMKTGSFDFIILRWFCLSFQSNEHRQLWLYRRWQDVKNQLLTWLGRRLHRQCLRNCHLFSVTSRHTKELKFWIWTQTCQTRLL